MLSFQVGLGLLLLFLLVFFCLCIAIAWRYYSPIIINFAIKEEQERVRRNSEREKQEKEKSKAFQERLDMDVFKNFLKKKKVEKHFKKTGPGQRLDSSSSAPIPSVVAGAAQGGGIDRVAASDIAAQAAIKRLYKAEPQISSSQKKIQMIAQRELEEERRRNDPKYALEQLGLEEKKPGPDVREFEHADVIKGVYFTCELLGDDEAMTKPELMGALEEFLISQLSCNDEDAVVPAVLLLYSLNKKQPKEIAVETIGKYLQNIIENPGEPKYRRIRLSNKAYQERVASVKGGREFLNSVGFEERMEPFKEGDAPEPFLVMPESAANNTGRLVGALEMLRDGQSVPIKVSRDTSIFALRENERVPVPRVPPDFYDLTADEIRREQQNRTEELNRSLMLRTKEMREKDEKLRQYTYKYTLVRVRLPDRYVLQGTFGCYEPFSAVREYVAKHLANEAALFSFRNPGKGGEPLTDETKTLAALGLAPAVVLHLDFDEPIGGPSLLQEYIDAAVPLVAH
ncbi:hypothetical protein Y032_0128g1433 [Ancylostoma ceylanicum]|uniref:UBX domain-containing protein n=1 Tax=Ancylostoma ceylanicum TaxID=53326 RepID=A0A016T7S1_9BILA|nr:hypothetical protein Y032_0128g1433 [Ancylostoma ceylanicum]